MSNVDAAQKERLKKIWGDDKLGRSADADYLIRFLTQRLEERDEGKKSYVLNIDAAWGGGKSFFLERLGQQMEDEGYLVTHVNAWADDHIDDPQIAVMAAIEAKIEETLATDNPLDNDWGEVKKYALPIAGALLAATETAIGSPLVKGQETFNRMMENSKTAIDVVVQEKKAVEEFKEAFSGFLGKLNEGRNLPFFILVDEMDRCRPPYAIALLERVKHLFDIDNVVFVFATDTEQLSHSIGAVYGAGFASRKYLQRFFDQTYLFEVPSLEKYVELLVDNHQLENANIIWGYTDRNKASFHLAQCFQAFGLDLRSVAQCIGLLSNICTTWEYDKVSIKGVALLPIIIAHQQQWEKIDNTVEELRKRSEPEWPRLHEWQVEGPASSMSWVTLWDVYKKVISALKVDVELGKMWNQYDKKLAQRQPDEISRVYFWVIEQVRQEQFDVSKSPNTIEKAILETYPEIVRSAGRFAQLEP